MLVIDDQKAFQRYCLSQREQGSSIGFVPTMGNLHRGHLSLVQRAKKENDVTIGSIFVNPLQFNDKSDFESYSKTLDDDLRQLKEEGVDVVFMPKDSRNFYGEHFSMSVEETRLSNHACGKCRPGHFLGVTTVVLKLFNLCMPNKAYFGMKDFQQLCIIKKMVEDLSLPIEIVACPIIREPSGLAMSSRNSRLTQAETELANHLYRGLQHLQGISQLNTQVTWKELYDAGSTFYRGIDPRLQLEYLEAFAVSDFGPVSPENKLAGQHWVICVAVRISDVRLIDNIQLASH